MLEGGRSRERRTGTAQLVPLTAKRAVRWTITKLSVCVEMSGKPRHPAPHKLQNKDTLRSVHRRRPTCRDRYTGYLASEGRWPRRCLVARTRKMVREAAAGEACRNLGVVLPPTLVTQGPAKTCPCRERLVTCVLPANRQKVPYRNMV